MAGNNRTIYGDIAPIPEPAVRKPFAEVVEPIRADWSQSNHWAFTLDKTRGWPINNTLERVFGGPKSSSSEGLQEAGGSVNSAGQLSYRGRHVFNEPSGPHFVGSWW